MKPHQLLLLSLLAVGAASLCAAHPVQAEAATIMDDGGQGPMINISPGDGGTIRPGQRVFVDNWTPNPATLKITLEDGTLLYTATIPPNSPHDGFVLPKLPILLGHTLKVNVDAGATTAKADIKIG
ncbi:MAG: hypothetical protein IPK67_00375 [Planctomycetes bacterium]|jgi:hypothetical protein|nr:hypothetical protein [Planctomycetota bacterium]